MERTFNFGKIDYNKTGRKINEVTVEAELEVKENGKTVDLVEKENIYTFTASGNVWNSSKSDIIAGGQILDEIETYLRGNKTFKKIYELWKKYHLNDLKSGTRKQNEALQNWTDRPKGWSYDEDCEYLKSIGLFEDNGFKYGHGWLVEEIPAEAIEEIKKLLEGE